MSQSSVARGAGVTANRGLGALLYTFDYWDATFPFLNVYKLSNVNQTMQTGSAWDTAPTAGCAGDLQVDANGYVKSLTGISGAVYSSVSVYSMLHPGTGPGITARFPPGPYRLKVTGKCVMSFSNQVTSLSGISPSSSTISGNTIDTRSTTGVTTVTINTYDGTEGIITTISAIPDPTDYPRAMSLVQSAQAANYDGGGIFHPTFLASLGLLDEIRVKDWNKTDICPPSVQFGLSLGINATSAVLRTYNYTTSAWQNSNWQRPTGTYLFTFNSGEQRNVLCTWNSPNISFPALTQAVPWDGTTYKSQAWYPSTASWANRSVFGDFSWATDRGCPYEVSMALANTLNGGAGGNMMFSYPPTVATPTGGDMTYINGLANLAFNGAGTTLPGFTGLKAVAVPEFSNETWNFSYPTFDYSVAIAKTLLPTATDSGPPELRGVMQAIIGDAWYAIYGATAFAQRVLIPMGGQTAWSASGGSSSWGIYYTVAAMETPHWTSRAKDHHIGTFTFAPYIGFYALVSAADQATILATTDPVHTWFGLAYTNNFEGHVYASVDPAGWAGCAKVTFQGLMAGLAQYNIPFRCYECGTDFFCHGMSAAWIALAVSAHYDPRIEYIFYDSTNQMFATYGYAAANGQKGLLQTMYDIGITHMDFTNFCDGAPGEYGEWGLIESVMQPVSPLSVAPLKYRAAMKFIQGL